MSDQERPRESSGTGVPESDSSPRTRSKGAPIALLDPRKLSVDEMVANVMRALRQARPVTMRAQAEVVGKGT